jgi:NitT/TauT family transport system permease protein
VVDVKPRPGPLPFLVTLAVLIAAWIAVHQLHVWPEYLFPGPLKVAQSIWHLAASGQLEPSLEATFRRLGIAYALALGVGGLLAASLVLLPPFRRGFQPFVLAMQSLPGIAWTPLALLWFGFRENALLFVTVVGSVFSMAMGFADAFATVPPLYHKAARNMGVRGWGLLTRVTVPAATPHLITAAKVGWSFAWRSLIGAEIVFASVGLGFLLNQGREFLDVAQVFATMIVLLAVGVVVERIVFARLEKAVRRRWGLS